MINRLQRSGKLRADLQTLSIHFIRHTEYSHCDITHRLVKSCSKAVSLAFLQLASWCVEIKYDGKTGSAF